MDLLALADPAAAHVFLRDLAVVLCVAAVTSVVFQRLKQPVVLGYLLAGIIVGPHTPGATIVDASRLHELSELGMILVLFSIGLEFSLRRLVEIGPRPAFIAAFQGGIMLWLGFLAGRLLGLDWRSSLFVGGIVSISSTVLIQRVFHEAGVEKPLREMVLGVLVYEDIVGILFIAGLTTLSLGEHVDGAAIAATGGKLLLFLGVVVVVGLLVVPRAVRFVIGLRRYETLVIACLGLCFALALAAQHQGYSTALGAFLAGSLIAESGHGHLVHERTQPVADVFAAVFFVAIGMQIDPGLLAENWVAILCLTLVTIFGKLFGTALGAFLVGAERRTALRAGISMAQIGEFAFIIAGIGVTSGTIPQWIAAAAVGVSTITAFVTPYFIARSDVLASAIDRALPMRLQNYAGLYTSWIADIRSHGPRSERSIAVRRAVRIVVIDAVVLGAIIVAGSILAAEIGAAVEERTHVGSKVAYALVVGAVAALCVPFLVGIVRGSGALARNLAELAMPSRPSNHFDAARAPRAALVAGLQFAVLLCVTLALLAATAPFLPHFVTPLVIVVTLVPFAWFLWRAALNLDGHLRAGAEIVADALSRASPKPGARELEDVQELLPGLGDITMLGLGDGDPGVGRTLAELQIRSLTGANVIVVQRGTRRITMPTGDERLLAGDVIALTGSHDAITGAVTRLTRPAPAAVAEAAR
jgi:CPA2 family monovalent cation:H+ antiporter-2